MTLFSDCRKNRRRVAPLCVKHECRRQFHFGCFLLLVATLFSPCLCHTVSAQENDLKDGAALYSIGFGYEWMSDAYSSNGFALDVRARFYLSGRLFGELMGHWGTHEGSRSVLQKGSPFDIDDERNTLLGAVGIGHEVFQLENQMLDIYIKGLVGYGVRSSRLDDYQPTGDEDGHVTLGREERRKGMAAVVGLGMDTRFKRWTLTPSVDVFYIGNEWNVAAMISFGFFL